MRERASCSRARACAICRRSPISRGFATTLDYVVDGLGPTDDPHVAKALLLELGLTGEENPRSLSGGEGRRAALARALAPEPDMLLLDEPTNHLDLPAILWLEERLAGLRSAIVVISHDRRFLAGSDPRDACGSTAGGRGICRAASRSSRPGATASSRKRKSSSTRSTARSSTRSIGCAMA